MKYNNIKIGFGAIGCALKFKKHKLHRHDGSLEYYNMLWTIVRNPAIAHVMLLQKSDWKFLNDIEKIEFDPRGVLFDPYSDELIFSRTCEKINDKEDFNFSLGYKDFNEYFKDKHKLDTAILFTGMGYHTSVSIPNFLGSLRKPNHKLRIQLANYSYSSPIIHFLNMSKIPWINIILDPRYAKKIFRKRDTINVPREIISQYNMPCTWESIDTYENNESCTHTETAKHINMIASGIEKLARINECIYPPDNDRPIKFLMGIMQSKYGQCEGTDSRLEMLKEWVFKYDNDNDIKIYGKWSSNIIKGYESWFNGMISYKEIDNKLRKTRYTLIKGIRKDWVTAKWADTLAQGVVPFMVPDYDTQYSIVSENHFVRVKSPSDLYKKMKYLDENPNKRIDLVNDLQCKLLKDTTTGKFIFNILNASFKRTNIKIELPIIIDETVNRNKSSKTLF